MKNVMLVALLLINLVTFGQLVEIKHQAYTIQYDTKLKGPILTYYTLRKTTLQTKVAERTAFVLDPALPAQYQNNADEYEGSKYDKGHLAPNDDFRWSAETEKESMYYTNAAPQWYSFNRGIWKRIENHVRYLASVNDSVVVYTGCLYLKPLKRMNGMPIPSHFFKVIRIGNTLTCFLAENRTQSQPNLRDYYVLPSRLKQLIGTDKRYSKLPI